MLNQSDRMEAKAKVFQTNLKHLDAPDNQSFGKMNGDKKFDGEVPVIKFSDGNFDENSNEDCDSDVISKYIGHYGWWQFFWTFLLCLCQCPSTFQIYAFVFQVSFDDLFIKYSFFFLLNNVQHILCNIYRTGHFNKMLFAELAFIR